MQLTRKIDLEELFSRHTSIRSGLEAQAILKELFSHIPEDKKHLAAQCLLTIIKSADDYEGRKRFGTILSLFLGGGEWIPAASLSRKQPRIDF